MPRPSSGQAQANKATPFLSETHKPGPSQPGAALSQKANLEARQLGYSQATAKDSVQDRPIDWRHSAAGQRPQIQHSGRRNLPGPGAPLGSSNTGRGGPLPRGPSPHQPGQALLPPRPEEYGQQRVLQERRSSGQHPAGSHAGGPPFLMPDAGRSGPAQPVRALSMGQRQIPQLKAPGSGHADDRQLSRAGEQLLMLVRLGDLKLPATVRRPRPIGV